MSGVEAKSVDCRVGSEVRVVYFCGGCDAALTGVVGRMQVKCAACGRINNLPTQEKPPSETAQ